MTHSGPPLLETRNLTRRVSGRTLIDGISLRVARGDVVAIVGPSGSGKTSLLRLLNRLDEPTGGTIFLSGQDFRAYSPRELRRRVGMVMQVPVLFPGTVAENLRYGPRVHGRDLEAREVDSLLARVGLEGAAARDAGGLSVGEAQRVSLARTLANGPEILLLDEPTAPLDARSKLGIERLIGEIVRSDRLTCLVVTHDLEQAARIADRVLVLKEGRLERIGTIQEVLDAE